MSPVGGTKHVSLADKVAAVEAERDGWIRLGSPCVLWQGARNNNGYGVRTVCQRQVLAHRYAYEMERGPIPDGLELDHLCRVRECVNPAHLEPVTHAENMRRSAPAQKTHCQRGHEFSDENTRIAPNGRRICRACRREWQRRDTARRKGVAA